VGESLKGNKNLSVHPVVKINYNARLSIAIVGFIGISTVLYFLHVELYIQKILILFVIWQSWPHLAYRLSINSKDQKKAEKRNVLLDFMLAGFLLCVIEFSFWPSFAATVIVVGNAIMVGGFRFLLKSITFFIFGPLVGFLLFGIDINQESYFWVTVAGVAGILSYAVILSTASYTQTQQRIQVKKQVKLKNQQLQNLSEKLSEFLPSQLVDNIADGQVESVSTHHRKKLTLFFSDIKDFTKMTDALEPEDLAKILNEYLTEMNKIINKYKGTLAQVIGDGLYIFFGAPKESNDKDHAIRCLKMAIDMQIKMKELNKKWFSLGIDKGLQIRCGINTGMATVGGYGSPERKEYTAMGMQVNIAARLESACKPGHILINHTTWVLVKDDIRCIEKGKIEVKGYHLPIKVYEVDTSKINQILKISA